MFNGIKRKLTDDEFLGLPEANQELAMQDNAAQKADALGDIGVMSDLKKQGFDSVESYRDNKDMVQNKKSTKMALDAIGEMMGAGQQQSSPVRIEAPQISMPKDEMAQLRQQVLQNMITSR